MYVLRLKYKKEKNMVFLSHLDMVRLMERSFRRAGVPLEFSNGFNPHPKINFAMPLSVGVSSEGEVMELEVKEKIDLKDFIKNQRGFFPDGIEIVAGAYVESSKSLMSKVKASDFIVKISGISVDESLIMEKLNGFLKEEEIIIEKTNKKNKLLQKNIRPGIFSMSFLKSEDGAFSFRMTVSSGSEFNVNPDDVINKFLQYAEINYEELKTRVNRISIFSNQNDALIDIFDSE